MLDPGPGGVLVGQLAQDLDLPVHVADALGQGDRLLHWRREQPALVHGSMSLLPCDEQLLALVREHGDQRVLCAFNFSDRSASLALPEGWQGAATLAGSGLEGGRVEDGTIHLEPWGGIFLAR